MFVLSAQWCILAIVASYWAITLLYVSPNNYVRIQCNILLHTFGLVFYQKWNFFAPPPTYNSKVYITFFSDNENESVVNLEIIEPILKAKQQKGPFGFTQENVLDYILSSASDEVAEEVGTRIIIDKSSKAE